MAEAIHRPTTHRATWAFIIPKVTLIDAVERKLAHHTERLEHWQARMEQAEQDVREKGIDFREAARPMQRSIALTAANNQANTAYFQQPTLHQEFITALQEAQWKVDEHREALREYQHWASALPHGPAEYTLTFDDARYFGL